MLKINIKDVSMNPTKFQKIANAANSASLQTYLTKEANNVLQLAFSKIPYNVRSKEPHMRDKYKVMKPSKTSFRINGVKYPSCQVRIKPQGKYQPYYAVVASGKRNGKKLVYSQSGAEPFALENTLRKNNNNIQNGAIDALQKEIGRINEE